MKLDISVEGEVETIPAEEEGDTGSYLATLNINGALHHLTIFPVSTWQGGQQAATWPFETTYDAMRAIDQEEGGDYQTIRFGEQEFCCVVTPFMCERHNDRLSLATLSPEHYDWSMGSVKQVETGTQVAQRERDGLTPLGAWTLVQGRRRCETRRFKGVQ